MQILIKKCDRCGHIIEQKEYTDTKSLVDTSQRNCLSFWEGYGEFRKKRHYELCNKCVGDFMNWIEPATVIQQEVALDERIKKTQEKCEKLKNALEKCEKQGGWTDETLAMTRAHNASVELDLSERQEPPATVPKIDKTKIKLKPGTHTYHIWTKEEDDFILHHSAGMTSNDLACKFGVTVSAVSSRRYNLLHGKV